MARIYYDAGFCPACESLKNELRMTQKTRDRLQADLNALLADHQKTQVALSVALDRLSGDLVTRQGIRRDAGDAPASRRRIPTAAPD